MISRRPTLTSFMTCLSMAITVGCDTEAGDPALSLRRDRQTGPTDCRCRGDSALQFCKGTDNYNSVWITKAILWPILAASGPLVCGSVKTAGFKYPEAARILKRFHAPIMKLNWGIPIKIWDLDFFWPYENPPLQVDIGSSYIALGGSLGQWYHMALSMTGLICESISTAN